MLLESRTSQRLTSTSSRRNLRKQIITQSSKKLKLILLRTKWKRRRNLNICPSLSSSGNLELRIGRASRPQASGKVYNKKFHWRSDQIWSDLIWSDLVWSDLLCVVRGRAGSCKAWLMWSLTRGNKYEKRDSGQYNRIYFSGLSQTLSIWPLSLEWEYCSS